jgi:hypothetical protein
VIIFVAWLCTGRAFRLTVYGTVFCWDSFTIRRAWAWLKEMPGFGPRRPVLAGG